MHILLVLASSYSMNTEHLLRNPLLLRVSTPSPWLASAESVEPRLCEDVASTDDDTNGTNESTNHSAGREDGSGTSGTGWGST